VVEVPHASLALNAQATGARQTYVARFLKGATLPVRVDPGDPQKVAVVWDTL